MNSLLTTILHQHDLLSEKNITQAVEEKDLDNMSLLQYLIYNNLLSAKSIASACAKYFDLPLIDLSKQPLFNINQNTISKKMIEKYLIVPVKKKNEKSMTIALSDPDYYHLIEEISFNRNYPIKIMFAPYDQFINYVNQVLSQTLYEQYALSKNSNAKAATSSTNTFMQQIISDAIHRNASDIHCEPFKTHYQIRFRIDGVLHTILHTTPLLKETIASYLKIQSNLDISEKRRPQDGGFQMKTVTNIHRNCRLSTCPTTHGEKVVIRLLSPQKKVLTISELGMHPKEQKCFYSAVHKPQGLILTTGPTGSGKTITLYAALNELSKKNLNIMTIEDPLEIELNNINQCNVNRKTGFEFTTALRTFLRQDPDIIMIGEIRDNETAAIAIRAAQTGHLVISTLHTNNACETIIRLLNLGISPYNLASVLLLIIAQRLVRKLCSHCKKISTLSQDFRENKSRKMTRYEAKGCHLCMQGYKGRTGVFELLQCNHEFKQILNKKNVSTHIYEYYNQNCHYTLTRSAHALVSLGLTTADEINRVL